MLTPQEVLMHAQAALIPGRKPPSIEGSRDCYACDVGHWGSVDDGNGLGGILCARHEKAVSKLMKSSFSGSHKVPAALVEQRRKLMTAVVAARERRQRSNSDLSGDSTSMFWYSSTSSSGSERSSSDSDRNSDGAVEDDDLYVSRSSSIPAIALPWRGSSRLATVIESDEEEEATPRVGSFTR